MTTETRSYGGTKFRDQFNSLRAELAVARGACDRGDYIWMCSSIARATETMEAILGLPVITPDTKEQEKYERLGRRAGAVFANQVREILATYQARGTLQ